MSTKRTKTNPTDDPNADAIGPVSRPATDADPTPGAPAPPVDVKPFHAPFDHPATKIFCQKCGSRRKEMLAEGVMQLLCPNDKDFTPGPSVVLTSEGWEIRFGTERGRDEWADAHKAEEWRSAPDSHVSWYAVMLFAAFLLLILVCSVGLMFKDIAESSFKSGMAAPRPTNMTIKLGNGCANAPLTLECLDCKTEGASKSVIEGMTGVTITTNSGSNFAVHVNARDLDLGCESNRPVPRLTVVDSNGRAVNYSLRICKEGDEQGCNQWDDTRPSNGARPRGLPLNREYQITLP